MYANKRIAPTTRKSQKQLVDEYAELTEELKPLVKQQKALKAELDAVVLRRKSVGDDDSTVLRGTRYTIAVSAKVEKAFIPNMRKVFDTIKPKQFWDNVSMALGELKQITTDAEYEKLTKKKPGYRRMTISVNGPF